MDQLTDENKKLNEQIDEKKDETSVENTQLRKDIESLKTEKDILISKLKKMQKLAAKVPVLEHENVNLRESLTKS